MYEGEKIKSDRQEIEDSIYGAAEKIKDSIELQTSDLPDRNQVSSIENGIVGVHGILWELRIIQKHLIHIKYILVVLGALLLYRNLKF